MSFDDRTPGLVSATLTLDGRGTHGRIREIERGRAARCWILSWVREPDHSRLCWFVDPKLSCRDAGEFLPGQPAALCCPGAGHVGAYWVGRLSVAAPAGSLMGRVRSPGRPLQTGWSGLFHGEGRKHRLVRPSLARRLEGCLLGPWLYGSAPRRFGCLVPVKGRGFAKTDSTFARHPPAGASTPPGEFQRLPAAGSQE